MKIIKLTLPLLFTVFVTTGLAQADSEKIKIRTFFNIKSSFCDIKTNGVSGLDNRNSAFRGEGMGISSTNSLLFLENGDNEISLEIGSLAWFSNENIDENARATFSDTASCKIDLVRWDKNIQNNLGSVSVSIDKDGVPRINSSSTHNISHEVVMAEQAISGNIDPKFYNNQYYPNNMKLHRFSLKVNIIGIPKWEWVNATPFTGTQGELEGLKNAYAEIAEIINNQDRNKLKINHAIALHAWTRATGSSEDRILLSQYPREDLEGGNVKIDPIKWNDYSVRIMNKGRLVQLYNKSKPIYSPLTYHSISSEGHKTMGFYAPMFSLINGKFVVVL